MERDADPGRDQRRFENGLNAAGVPAYGVTMLFTDPDGNGVHAANERVRVRSVEEGRTFLHRLVRVLSDQPG